MALVDKTGQPRSNQDLIDARQAISKELIKVGNLDPIQVYYPTIIEAITELLKRRSEDGIDLSGGTNLTKV